MKEKYTFKINAYTLDTIPMARLAEYMSQLAEMFGEKDSVHFLGLKPGSVNVLACVENEAAPKVAERIVRAQAGDGDLGASRAITKLNEMLRKDNADGVLKRNNNNIIQFPGKRAILPARLGPFTEATEIDGVLCRVGGQDSTAHAMIEDAEGEVWSFEVSHELAKALAPYLYEGPIRLIGTGRWVRTEQGVWEHSALKATNFVELKADTLLEGVQRIRDATKQGWAGESKPLAQLQNIRGDNKGVH